MITEKQILIATSDELSRLAGEVFLVPRLRETLYWICPDCGCVNRPRRKDHKWTYKCPYFNCTNSIELSEGDFWVKPTPIPLTWDNAMKFRDWAVEKYGDCFYDEMYNVYTHDNFCGCFNEWLVGYAKPEHYLKAAAICKLNSEEGI